VTILLYVNVGWDAAKQGGCLRIHPTTAQRAEGMKPVDIDPVAGRLVLFQSAMVPHEVRQVHQGERLALTLWLEYADEGANA